MKKILAILAMAVSSGVFAASATLEFQNANGVQNTPNDQQNINLTVRENINKNFIGDVQLSNTYNNTATSDAAANFRTEGGLTGITTVGPVKLYTRGAVGQKFTTTTNFTYYSVEPGVIVPFGTSGVSAKVAYRFRNAFDTGNNDTTRTWRAGLAYDLTAKDQVGVRYDSVRGDSNQNVVSVNYTRGF